MILTNNIPFKTIEILSGHLIILISIDICLNSFRHFDDSLHLCLNYFILLASDICQMDSNPGCFWEMNAVSKEYFHPFARHFGGFHASKYTNLYQSMESFWIKKVWTPTICLICKRKPHLRCILALNFTWVLSI